MNKIFIAGVLMFIGGFAIADAANMNLLAEIGSPSHGEIRKQALASVTPFPATTVSACKAEAKKAEDAYKLALQTAKEKRDMANRARMLCIRKVNEAHKSVKPSPTASH